MSRDLQQQLLTRIDLAVTMLDLPLTRDHMERLAVELTPAVKAILAQDQAVDVVPVAYAVVAGVAETATHEYAACAGLVEGQVEASDVDSPAAVLAQRLRSSQPDVTATDVLDATTLGLTVRPQSIDCWRWWMHRLNIAINSVQTHGDAVTATGHLKGVRINLRGDGVPALLTDKAAARLAGVIAGHPW
ncbi:hypothetical protein [Streptomyces sp. NBC_00620]|uniref:hypothetical protein n=1 Tax=Streptomyces sp. NBC_00620 TaxID=2903666 RepID=UPI002252FE72|nr:hypothetical protein [Streptomyces sp. NBC_00620]MCX4974274.1 hypothetical protein [Streptomyces sp. NBC_00620]